MGVDIDICAVLDEEAEGSGVRVENGSFDQGVWEGGEDVEGVFVRIAVGAGLCNAAE